MSHFVDSFSPATTKQIHVSKELTICQESGKAYRPFINPKRIQSNDAKKSLVLHTKGVPDEYLRIIPPTTESQESAGFIEKGGTATSPTGSVPGRVIIFDSRPSGRQRPNDNLSTPDPGYTSVLASSMPQLSLMPVTSSLATSFSEYPDLAPSSTVRTDCLRPYWHPFTTESGYHDAPYSDTTSDSMDFGFNLEDPYVFSEAFKIARQMNLQTKNGAHFCPKYDSTQTTLTESDNGSATHRSSYGSNEDTNAYQVNHETIFAPQPLHASPQFLLWSEIESYPETGPQHY